MRIWAGILLLAATMALASAPAHAQHYWTVAEGTSKDYWGSFDGPVCNNGTVTVPDDNTATFEPNWWGTLLGYPAGIYNNPTGTWSNNGTFSLSGGAVNTDSFINAGVFNHTYPASPVAH